jgi:phospholipase/carboxylesterase
MPQINDRKPELVNDGPTLSVAGLTHRVLEPESSGPYPTVVMFHGRFGDENAMWIFARALPDDWLVVAPRAIYADRSGYSWQIHQNEQWPCLSDYAPAVTAVHRFLDAMPELYHADPGRIYLMGFSQGAAAAFALALDDPERARGIAGVVGFVPEECETAVAPRPLEGLPMFMAVGKDDQMVPYEIAQKSCEVIENAGADLEYHEYDTGHKLNAQGMKDLKQWWQRRKAEAI